MKRIYLFIACVFFTCITFGSHVLAAGRTVVMPCQSNAPNVNVANQHVNHVYADSCSSGQTNGNLILENTIIDGGIGGTPANYPIEPPTAPTGPFNLNQVNIDEKSKVTGSTGKPGIELNVYGGVKDKIKTINNYGTIEGSGVLPGILNNGGEITELNNMQGGDTPLKYKGDLPEQYKQIIEGGKHGKIYIDNTNGISGVGPTKKLEYGITNSSGNPGNARPGTLEGPVTIDNTNAGVNKIDIANKKGSFGDRGNFDLICTETNSVQTCNEKISGLYTDFIGFNNPNVPNTYAVVSSNRDALTGLMHQRYAVLNAVMQYDCKKFDAHGFCLSFQARSTGFGTQATGAGVLNASYRASEQIRIGAYLDYQVAAGNPWGNTSGIMGGVQAGYDNPTFGGYVGYSGGGYGSKPGYIGLQLKVSGGYNPGKVSITRGLLYATEPATGTTGLNSYYIYGSVGWGYAINDITVIEPYLGMGYTNITRNAYTEGFNLATTLFPLAYNSFYEQLVTGYAGAHMRGMLTENLGYQLGAAGQFDLNRSANGYTGWSTMPGMGIFGVQHGGTWNGVRPVGNAGVFYDVSKNERIMLNGYTGQQAFTTRSYLTGLAGYQVSF